MSTTTSLRQKVVIIPARTWLGPHVWAAFELCEDSNSFYASGPHNGKPARHWNCIKVFNAEYGLMAEMVRNSSACCGGCLRMPGRHATEPERYIRAWRKALQEATPMGPDFPITLRLNIYLKDVYGKPRPEVDGALAELAKMGIQLTDGQYGGKCAPWPTERPLEDWAKIATGYGLSGWECLETSAPMWP